MNPAIFSGTIPALMTPCKADRTPDFDKLVEKAWDLFGETPTGWARVQAICDYVHGRIQFGYEFADATKGAALVAQSLSVDAPGRAR